MPSIDKILIRLFIVLSICTFESSYAQSQKDSLLKLYNSDELSEQDKISIYANLALTYQQFNIDSSNYYAERGLKTAEESGNTLEAFKNTLVLGNVAMRRDSLIQAYGIYLKALELINEVDYQRGELVLLLKLGMVTGLISNFEKSLEYNYKGLLIADSVNDVEHKAAFSNNLAMVYGKIENYQKETDYFVRTAEFLKQINNDRAYGVALLNIGGSYLKQELLDSAEYFLHKSKEIHEKFNDHYSLLEYYGYMGRIESHKGNYHEALSHIHQMNKELEKLDDTFFSSKLILKITVLLSYGDTYYSLKRYEKAIESYLRASENASIASSSEYLVKAHKGLSQTYEKMGKVDSALFYFKSFKRYNDIVVKQSNAKKIAELEVGYQFEQEKRQIQFEKEKSEAEHKSKTLILLIIIGASVSGALLLLLLFLRQKDKYQQSRLLAKYSELEKDKLHKELEFKRKELTTNVIYLLRKNEFISEISKKLVKINTTEKESSSKLLDIIKDLDKNTSESAWAEFETRFQEVHGDFYEKLTEKFPNLTPNELKLCGFLKLNMTTKDISAITFQTPETLKTARHRLRKKLGLSREANLISFLNQL